MSDRPRGLSEGVMALDELAAGVDGLASLGVFAADTGETFAAWTRSGADHPPALVGGALRALWAAAADTARDLDGDATAQRLLTLETVSRLVLIGRVRAFAVAAVFDGGTPQGLARIALGRALRTLGDELPYPVASAPPPPVDDDPSSDRAPDTVVRSLAGERVRAILHHLETTGPDPHIARTRVALRTGLGRDALAQPETLSPEAASLVEAVAEDILGVRPLPPFGEVPS